MALTSIHADDYGFPFRLTCTEDGSAADISSFTTLQYVFRKPDKTTTVTKTATFNTDGTDGVLSYTIETGVLDIVGLWQVAARLTKGSEVVTSEAVPFYVESRLD